MHDLVVVHGEETSFRYVGRASSRLVKGVSKTAGALALGVGFLSVQFFADLVVDPECDLYASSQLLSAHVVEQDSQSERYVPPIDSKTFEKISKFNSILAPEQKEGVSPPSEGAPDARDLDAAQRILDDLLEPSRRLNDHELAQVHFAYAWLAGELDDTTLAAEHLYRVLDFRESIPYEMEGRTLKLLSMLRSSLRQSGESLEQDEQDMNISGSELSHDQIRGYLPLRKVEVVYPQRAVERGIEGYVVLRFTVTETGSVKDPVVFESEPPGIFDRAAIQAALKFKYRPKVINGVPVEVEGVLHRFGFEIDGDASDDLSNLNGDDGEYLPLKKVDVVYPQRALERGIEGHVVLRFTVTETGAVKDPVVFESEPPGIFDRAAIQAALKFEYQPKVVDGTPIEVEGVLHRIGFEIDDGD